jgi:hypothetical protein
MGLENVPGIHLTWGTAQWWAFVDGVTNFPVPRMAANFLAEEC